MQQKTAAHISKPSLDDLFHGMKNRYHILRLFLYAAMADTNIFIYLFG